MLLLPYRRNLGPTAHLQRLRLLRAPLALPSCFSVSFSPLSLPGFPRLNHRWGPEKRCGPDDNTPSFLLDPPAVHRESQADSEDRGKTTQVCLLSAPASAGPSPPQPTTSSIKRDRVKNRASAAAFHNKSRVQGLVALHSGCNVQWLEDAKFCTQEQF